MLMRLLLSCANVMKENNNFAAIGVVRGPALAAVAGFRSGARIAGDRAMVRLLPIISRSRTARG